MGHNDLPDLLAFIKTVELMKVHTRTAWNSEGKQESIAEHSWRLSLMALFLYDIADDIDLLQLIKLCIVHDLGEVYEGDISAKYITEDDQKGDKELRAIHQLMGYLGRDKGQMLKGLWEEYEAGNTKEAKLAKALDKMETIIQHIQGDNPEDFDYQFNLEYGKEYTDSFELTKALRAVINKETSEKMDV
jgi:putative hydrolase of HD superfamily